MNRTVDIRIGICLIVVKMWRAIDGGIRSASASAHSLLRIQSINGKMHMKAMIFDYKIVVEAVCASDVIDVRRSLSSRSVGGRQFNSVSRSTLDNKTSIRKGREPHALL
ncbi:unnamed protein product [Toxocara canis]|uniref:Secreted protein n=1 Tax=Toxocara canis TaxID=6265 RepID=A0A183UPK3_TOXCA|nr:unnamed protein product [Toxocara canis]